MSGILTGIGIIGTFSGLIFGLMDFQISENPNVVRSSLATLVQSVGQAFILSGSAIALAMLTTWLEKSIVTLCYRQVEGICQGVDSLFDAGAGEEYLARLVTAAEESATQSAQMKDSLVTDLKQILTELTEMQIQAAGSHNQQLSTAVVGAINESLKEPMQQLSAGMNTVAGDQGTAINALLTALLVTLMFWHAKLGVQVIIEDYVHCHGKKLVLMLLNSGLNLLLGAASLLAIAQLHFFKV